MALTWERLRCRCTVVAASASRGLPAAIASAMAACSAAAAVSRACVVGGQPADPDQVHAQAPHGLGQVGVGDGRIDGLIEPAHKLVVLVPGGIVRLIRAGASSSSSWSCRKTCGVAALGCQRGGLAFERFAELEELVDVVQRDIGDDDAAAAGRRRESFRGEPAQGLPERRAGNAQAFGLLDFGQDGPGAEAPFDDVVAQCRVGPVAGAHPASLRR